MNICAYIFFVAAIILNPLLIKAQNGIITTIAGNGISASLGDGGLATAAQILNPPAFGIFDANGNYYFSERYSHKVRKISSTGIISTYAGNGIAGYSGDGVIATATCLNNPCGLAIDNVGNLYISEIEGCRVRKINAGTNIITTFAGNGIALENGDGGQATAASVYFPNSLCFDYLGNLYIADADNRVRNVNITTGIINTIAGIGGVAGFSGDNGPADLAKLNGPIGICTDHSNNLYISDHYNNRIRKVTAATNVISTIAGNNLATYNGEGLLATAAQLSPKQISFDAIGNLFVADIGNHRIRKIDFNGYIYTVVGTGTSGFGGDGGFADSAMVAYPEGIAFDSCGNLFFPDNGNARIRKVTFNPECWPVAIKDVKTVNLSIFPTPATDIVHITGVKETATYTLYEMTGRAVICGVLLPKENEINISNLAMGMYLLQVQHKSGEREIRKIVKE